MTAVLLVLLLLAAMQPIRLSADKTQSFAPLDVTAQIVVPRHVDNRRVCVALSYAGEKEDFSCVDLSEHSSPVVTRKWRMWEPGKHFAQAWLYRSSGSAIYSNVIEFRVAGEE